MSEEPSLSRAPLWAAIASISLAPTVWLLSFFVGLFVESLPFIFAGVAVFYALGFLLACYGLPAIPKVGTRGVLLLGLIGGVLNALLLTAAIVALVMFRLTYA